MGRLERTVVPNLRRWHTDLPRRRIGNHYQLCCTHRKTTVTTPSASFATVKSGPGEPWDQPRLAKGVLLTLTACTIAVAVSYQTRIWRQERIRDLPDASDPDVWNAHFPHRRPTQVVQVTRRCGLMGSTHSVKAELDRIRDWHHQNGYVGGLVLRDLTRPVFGFTDDVMSEEEDWTLEDIIRDPTRLNRRECYYLYYEIMGNGAIQQEIYCRGTTLLDDVLTCLQAWMVYDDDLGCRVHRGFRNQADRILRDVLPLLAPRSDRRATVEVCGHSLGGAVAAILAVKLGRLGYRVTRLTTIGEPRFCASEQDAEVLLPWLPIDNLRVESDQDFVPFLPPFGAHVGKKLWFLQHDELPRLVPAQTASSSLAWTDSVWTNFRMWEILSANGKPHRIPSYVDKLKRRLVPS
ncbi:predicted protein [Phaeodactylum tricornutum CCAP 1055/1]|jgi:hypothetical protein|uniref:Fungal lipase-type domain-containing protein n=1 Tax=Phaeodactylum tricornutum (strain CCAP 1055/1) TaxID=556484 RepID=B5Y3P0_PHATC|nr:predicted protein [Phaeodactylum tricornutum CCAP 1055/1]ACI65342.1 predicted protein [Phaeodactylum tricornutum CCAP 1055/1]|eukprot:XP_002185872.1 predicted protein [Phaeodactylum tricornutum CCAP 1055/1]